MGNFRWRKKIRRIVGAKDNEKEGPICNVEIQPGQAMDYRYLKCQRSLKAINGRRNWTLVLGKVCIDDVNLAMITEDIIYVRSIDDIACGIVDLPGRNSYCSDC